MLIRVLICLVSMALAGCSQTFFESLPVGEATSCDPRLVGTWRTGEWALEGADDKVADDQAKYALITPKCQLLDWYTRQPPEELGEETGLVPLRFIAGKNGGYAYSRNDLVDPEESEYPWATGYLLFRYVVSPDRIAVYQVDSPFVARLITTNEIASGRSAVRNRQEGDDQDVEPEYSNLVSGTQAELTALLKKYPKIFYSRPMGILHRYKGVPPPEPDADQEEVIDDGGGAR